MSRKIIIKKLKSKNSKISSETLSQIFDSFIEKITQSLYNNKPVEIRGLGSFFIKEINEKKNARNPKTGEIIYIPKKNKVRFRASKRLKELINKQ